MEDSHGERELWGRSNGSDEMTATLTTNSVGTPLIIEARVALQGLLDLAVAERDAAAYGLKLAVDIVEALITREGKRQTGGAPC